VGSSESKPDVLAIDSGWEEDDDLDSGWDDEDEESVDSGWDEGLAADDETRPQGDERRAPRRVLTPEEREALAARNAARKDRQRAKAAEKTDRRKARAAAASAKQKKQGKKKTAAKPAPAAKREARRPVEARPISTPAESATAPRAAGDATPTARSGRSLPLPLILVLLAVVAAGVAGLLLARR
jgi:cobalamin biosynthesis Mg chelatase CobN